jgi:hypothetical protein
LGQECEFVTSATDGYDVPVMSELDLWNRIADELIAIVQAIFLLPMTLCATITLFLRKTSAKYRKYHWLMGTSATIFKKTCTSRSPKILKRYI